MSTNGTIEKHISDLVVAKILEEAEKWVGTKELGKNKGFDNPDFEKLLKQYGWQSGWAWCMSSVRAIYGEVYKNTPYYDDLMHVLTHGCVVTWNRAKASKFTTGPKPVVGGIVLWGTGKGQGHAGIPKSLVDEDAMSFVNYEGNTSPAGVREGDTYMTKKRVLIGAPKYLKGWVFLGCIHPPTEGITVDMLP